VIADMLPYISHGGWIFFDVCSVTALLVTAAPVANYAYAIAKIGHETVIKIICCICS